MGIRRVWVGAMISVAGVAALALAGAPNQVRAAVQWVYNDLPTGVRHESLTQKPGRVQTGEQQAPAPAPVPSPQPKPAPQPEPKPAPVTEKPAPQPAPEPAPPAPAPTPAKETHPAPTEEAPAPPPPSTAGNGPQPLRRVAAAGQAKQVFLTFDDGPTSYNPQLTAILKAEHIPAAFFWIGGNTKAGQAAELTAQGFQIGSHTMTHARMTTLTPDAQASELTRSLKALQPATTTYFRPPFGAYNAEVIQSATKLGLTVVMWDVDSRDWELGAHPEQIVPNVMSHVRNGSIILLHERTQTVKILPDLIKALRDAGYTFQALPASQVKQG